MGLNNQAAESAYLRDDFTCVYCGFDGHTFETWMNLTIDHLVRRERGGADAVENYAVACHSCRKRLEKFDVPPGLSREEMIEVKRARIGQLNEKKKMRERWERMVPRRKARRKQ